MNELTALVVRALEEDVGSGDVTTLATVSPGARARARIMQKEPGVIYGMKAAETAFAELDPEVRIERNVDEGVWREQGAAVMTVEGKARALLTAERTALNLLSHLSGVASAAPSASNLIR